jgi:hypothetical protein
MVRNLSMEASGIGGTTADTTALADRVRSTRGWFRVSDRTRAREAARSRMTELVLTTYDWVTVLPRGYVRDLRIRWGLEPALP